MGHFVVDEKRSRRETRNMILTMGKYGNHNKRANRRLETDEDVIAYLRDEGIDFDKLVEGCRHKDQTVPRVENLIGSQVTGSPGTSISVLNPQGDTLASLSGKEAGILTMSTYWSRFERATSGFDRCLKTASYEELLSTISSGVSSIEAYIGHKVEEHNRQNPGQELIDNKQNKVSFDDKIKYWIPQMSGQKFDKGKNQNWADFKKTRGVRDKEDAHPGTSAYAHSFKSMEKLLNLFRGGIAGFLLDLCTHFGEKRIPTIIIRRAYMPKVRYKAVDITE